MFLYMSTAVWYENIIKLVRTVCAHFGNYNAYRLAWFSIDHLIRRKEYLLLHHFCHPCMKWPYIKIWKFYTSKETLLVVSFVCQFVGILPMCHARKGNNKRTSQSLSFLSHYTPGLPTKMLHQFLVT